MPSEPALVLPVDAVASTSDTYWPDFPGVFTPGQPIAISALGFETLKDAEAAAKELGLPLKRSTVEVPETPDVEPELLPVEPDPTVEPAASADEGKGS